jgi:hypothetical protein
MNRVITTHVTYRGSLIPVDQLKEQSGIYVEIECTHGRRQVRWNRRHSRCRQCLIDAGAFNTSKPGRKITWGDKISASKKGVPLTDDHKKALSISHLGVPLSKEHVEAQNRNRPYGPRHHSWRNTPIKQKKIRKAVSNAIYQSLRSRSSFKTKSVLASLPYSMHELCEHLESRFEPGMSWDNYGKHGWHIDHIKPQSWFQYSSENDPQFIECWSLSNLQPLWASDNCKKGNRYIG